MIYDEFLLVEKENIFNGVGYVFSNYFGNDHYEVDCYSRFDVGIDMYETLHLQNTIKGKPVKGVRCEALRSVPKLKIVVPDNIVFLERGAFKNSPLLQEIVLPKTLRKIGQSAFQNCERLTTVTIPEGTEFIGDSAFLGTSLKEIFVPKSVSNFCMSSFDEKTKVFVERKFEEYDKYLCLTKQENFFWGESFLAKDFSFNETIPENYFYFHRSVNG